MASYSSATLASLLVVWSLSVLAGCQAQKPPEPQAAPVAIDYTQPLPEGQVALRKILPADYPDFSQSLGSANVADLRVSASNSLTYFSRAGSRRRYPYLDIDHDRAIASLRAFVELIDSGAFSLPAAAFNQKIADTFEVYQSVGAPRPDGGGFTHKVLFTGYFTPTYDASLTREGAYVWPLYRRPADLVSDSETDTAGRQVAPGQPLVPYYTRQEIESGALSGNELVYLSSRWNAYVITVQGSARLKLTDGRIMEVGYAGNNGRDYVSPGLKMVQDGLIARKDLSFDAMRRYFEANPQAMDTYLFQNPRTVFFKEDHGGPFGALNVPVTRWASIATDKGVYPAGMVAFASVPVPAAVGNIPNGPPVGGGEFAGFLLDQDRGGAIRSAGRCDIYMGIGEQAEQTAGFQLNPGKLYYLAVKPQLVSHYSGK